MAGIGVDGCKGGWIYFRLEGADPEYGVAPSLGAVLERSHPGDLVLADVPLGMLDGGPEERVCDRLARELLGPSGRGSSVFPVPCRPALSASGYANASRINQELSGRRLSRQSWSLAPRIREADALWASSSPARERMRESHPEVNYWGLTGRRGMSASKRTREGFLDRLAVLERAWPGAEDIAARAFMHHGGFRASRDDVLDALVLAIAASWPTELVELPSPPEEDSLGIPMTIVYTGRCVWPEALPSESPE